MTPFHYSVQNSGIEVKHFDAPNTLRLVHTDANGRATEEVVFTIQGVLSGKNLPPVTEKIRSTSQARYLQQGITLIGSGTPTFEEAIDAAQEIYSIFDRNVQDTSLESWSLPSSPITQGRALDASNRYLTSKQDTPAMASIPIPTMIDPQGILKKLTKEGFLYSKENEVQYYQVHKSDKGTNRFEPVGPEIFQIGDIAKIQVSFIAVPLKDNKHKMIVVLRSITLLDQYFSQIKLLELLGPLDNQAVKTQLYKLFTTKPHFT
ncbi:hypothetical protein BYT27DRAFT_7226656 [Phlegmacium glaucopus]|nr:hypothetical protein BYT27DRAFT_7226656 [Phlegmacium glaucopus]